MGEENTVLYKLIESRISDMEGRLEKRFDSQDKKQEKLETSISSLEKTIRGHNGTPGIITQMALLEQKIDNMCEEEAKDKEKMKDSVVTWSYIRDKAFLPILTAFALWLLLTVLPRIVVNLGIGVK